MTLKLYDDYPYLCCFDANAIDCQKEGEVYKVELDRTAFFPCEGGQSADSGTIGGIPVLDVILQNDKVIHILPQSVMGFCRCEINFQERFDKMQQHTAEHIVCGIAHALYGYENAGFHLGKDDVTFDLSGPLTKKQLEELEALANEAVFKNKKITAYYPKDPSKLKYRSKLELKDNVRIVEIEDIDVCACCAPHVKMTGEVGFIEFTDAYAYKGGTRIHLAAGARAVKDHQVKKQALTEIAKALSSPVNQTARFFKKYTDDVAMLRQKLSELKKDIIKIKIGALEKKDRLIVFENDVEPSYLRAYASELLEKYETLGAVFVPKDDGGFNFVIVSQKINLQQFMKDFSKDLGAKGGGTKEMVQGSVFATCEQIENYITKKEM